MPRVTDGLYEEDGEVWRWSVMRRNDESEFEVRYAIKEPYTGTLRHTIFTKEAIGENAKSVNLEAEHIKDAIQGLQEALKRVQGIST